MNKTLITLLGKGRPDLQTGYRETTYRFDDGTDYKTPFFGMALANALHADTVVILGTAASMWGILVENFTSVGDDENLRLELLEAETQSSITQDLLDRVTPLLNEKFPYQIVLRLIPSGVNSAEQIGILEAIANTLGKRAELHFDITHGYRTLAIVGFLSSSMLERLHNQVAIKSIWYGALDMTRDGITPVLCLEGLLAVQRWVSALDRFDANGNYGIFKDLLQADGLSVDKARCLTDAAFYESCTQIANAARSLNTVLPELDRQLSGASALFQERLKKHLLWAKRPTLAKQQIYLAQRALKRGDLLRAAILGLEAMISNQCIVLEEDPNNYTNREKVNQQFREEIKNESTPNWLSKAYRNLKHLRNSLAHGTRPHIRSLEKILKNPDRLNELMSTTLSQIDSHINNPTLN